MPCPFCGGEAKLEHDTSYGYSDPDGYRIGEKNTVYVKCINCGAMSCETDVKWLKDFAPHTVDQYRKDPILRAKTEEEYEKYKAEIDASAVSDWNSRADACGCDVDWDRLKFIETTAHKLYGHHGIGQMLGDWIADNRKGGK
jgi:hypothetical protein